MAADEERRDVNVDLAELKNLQTIVLDLEELKQLQSIAKRPRVRSLLSLEISNLQAKIVSNSTISGEEAPQEDTGKVKVPKRPAVRKCAQRMFKRVIKTQVVQNTQKKLSIKIETDQLASSNLSVPAKLAEIAEEEIVPSDNGILAIGSGETIDIRNNQVMREDSSLQTRVAEMGLKRKHKEIEEPENSMMKKKPKLTNIQQPPVINGSSCSSMEEELNQLSLQTRTSGQVLQERADRSDANEATHVAFVVTESAGVSNKTNQIMPSPDTVATSKSRPGLPRKRQAWGLTCQRVHANLECLHHKCSCFKCHKTGHVNTKCPKAPQHATIPSGTRTATNGSSCESLQEEPNQQCLQTKTSEQVLQEKTNPSDVNEASPMAVLATESADVSNKTSQIMPRRYVLIESDQQQKNQTTNHREDKPSSLTAVAASGSRRQRTWCHICQVPTHADSKCDRRNRTCFKCHENGHFAANCPNAPQNTIYPSEKKIATAGNTVVHAVLNEEAWEETGSMPTENGVDLMQASGSRRQRTWCRRCQVPTHAESECDHCNQTCFICHGKGHFAAKCPNAPQNNFHPGGLRTATAGDNMVVHALLDDIPQV